jgi:hypothetical protein
MNKMKLNLQLFGGRGAGSGIPFAVPSGGSGGSGRLDQQPGLSKTLEEALGAKGRPLSTDKAVLGANPFHSMGREYQENCQRCVIATEARFRGYNVVALPTFDGDTMPTGDNFANNFKNAKVNRIGRTTPNATKNSIEKQMKQYGDGSRAIIAVAWKGKNAGGHVVNVIQRNGKTHVYDGQTGKQYKLSDLMNASRTEHTRLVRVDNLEFSNQAREAVRRKK